MVDDKSFKKAGNQQECKKLAKNARNLVRVNKWGEALNVWEKILKISSNSGLENWIQISVEKIKTCKIENEKMLQSYRGTFLVGLEYNFMIELENIIGEAIPVVDNNWYITFGYIPKNNHVTHLGLAKKGLKNLPESIGCLTSLKSLNLGDNLLNSLPESIGNLILLNELRLTDNKLSFFPESIENLKSIKFLYLDGEAEEYPKLWGVKEAKGATEPVNYHDTLVQQWELEFMEELDKILGKIPFVPEVKWDTFGFTTHDNYIVQLGLYNKKLTSIPDTIGNLISLEELWLYKNQLVSLPESIGDLRSLEFLKLHSNQLISLPKSIGQLKYLKELDLRWNKLSSLPDSIGNLSSLKVLYLWDNELSSLPDTIGCLSSLKELYLWDNDLSSLPESIGELSSLIYLRLGCNQLTSLPDTIGNLNSLEELWLYKNQLSFLPESIGNLINLKELDLRWNNLSDNKLTFLPKMMNIWLETLKKKGCIVKK